MFYYLYRIYKLKKVSCLLLGCALLLAPSFAGCSKGKEEEPSQKSRSNGATTEPCDDARTAKAKLAYLEDVFVGTKFKANPESKVGELLKTCKFIETSKWTPQGSRRLAVEINVNTKDIGSRESILAAARKLTMITIENADSGSANEEGYFKTWTTGLVKEALHSGIEKGISKIPDENIVKLHLFVKKHLPVITLNLNLTVSDNDTKVDGGELCLSHSSSRVTVPLNASECFELLSEIEANQYPAAITAMALQGFYKDQAKLFAMEIVEAGKSKVKAKISSWLE